VLTFYRILYDRLCTSKNAPSYGFENVESNVRHVQSSGGIPGIEISAASPGEQSVTDRLLCLYVLYNTLISEYVCLCNYRIA
jgi:hypothetical protein